MIPSKLSRILRALKYIITGKGSIFIGDIAYVGDPISVKTNMYRGNNTMYRAYPGQYCLAITKDMDTEYQEVTHFSVHENIPLYRVTFETCKPVLTSPLNSILVSDIHGWRIADLTKDEIVGKRAPCYVDGDLEWDKIVAVEDLKRRVTMYDISMGEHNTFLTGEGVFLYDTASIHVPITNKGIEDSFKMLPSRNIVWEATGLALTRPEHAAASGLYLLTGTPEGRKKVNSILPKEYAVTKQMNKSDVSDMIVRMEKDDVNNLGRILNELRKLGDEHIYETGLTLSLEDMKPMKNEREKIIRQINSDLAKVPKKDRSIDIVEGVFSKHMGERSKMIVNKLDKSNPLSVMLSAKARGNPSQFGDLVISPIGVKGSAKVEDPIAHSYIEGLEPWEYYLAASGARQGVIGRSTMTAKPGALASELLATANQISIGDQRGDRMNVIDLPVSDPLELEDRVVGKDIKVGNRTIIREGTVLTPKMIQTAKKEGISSLPVYTPLGSTSSDGTIPALAYGVGRKGSFHEPGTNIGVMSAHAVVEPLFGSAMGSFHHGASLEEKQLGYPRIRQLLELTKKLPHEATLSSETGSVESVIKDEVGGHNVIINGKKHYVMPGNTPKVKEGDKLTPGDPLSDGPIQPSQIAEYKGLDNARLYMVDELKKNLPNLKRRNAEVIVESITRWGQIIDQGDSEYLPGDIELISKLESINEDIGNKVTYKPVFKGINQLPQITQGWMSQLGFRNLKQVHKKNIAEGAEEAKHSYSPTIAAAYGHEFGLGEKGKW